MNQDRVQQAKTLAFHIHNPVAPRKSPTLCSQTDLLLEHVPPGYSIALEPADSASSHRTVAGPPRDPPNREVVGTHTDFAPAYYACRFEVGQLRGEAAAGFEVFLD